MALPTQPKATRRNFVKLAAAAAAGVAAGPLISRNAQAKPVSITFARESSYVKNFDVHFQNVMAPAYEKATGIKIEYQIQAAGGSAVPQLVSMVENKSGADLAWVQQEWLYRDALVDVSDIAEEVGKQQGGWYDEIKRLSVDKGKWKSVPHGNIGQLMNYRRDWFDEVGIKKFPETWDEFLEAGIKLKAKGHPFGMSMGHGFADNYSWLYPLLWSYGVTVMDKDGKKVALDSQRDREGRGVRQEALQGSLHRGLHRVAGPGQQQGLPDQPDLVHQQRLQHHGLGQARPAGDGQGDRSRPQSQGPHRPALPRARARDARRVRVQQGPRRRPRISCAGPWTRSSTARGSPPATCTSLRTCTASTRRPSGTSSRASSRSRRCSRPASSRRGRRRANRQHGEVVNRWIVIDMFTKAITGTPTKTAIAEAVSQLKTIYG